MQCPSCGHNGMLLDDHHGMEHNVCEQCGTVIECDSFVEDTFRGGLQGVSFHYRSKPKCYAYGILLNPKSKTYKDSADVMYHLLDRLNLPIAARELAMHFLQYTKAMYDRQCCVGACVYMAMKRHDIPITIKHIANFLNVSHFGIGKEMKKLEKKIGAAAKSNAFKVDRLTHIIFSHGNFGGSDGGKRRFDILLSKTEHLLQFLQECEISSSYQPHIIILAAGYIVWRNLKHQGWNELKDGKKCLEVVSEKGSLKLFLNEAGIVLSSLCSIHDKINVISNLFSTFASQLPWISADIPPKKMVYLHLDDFLKYKTQLFAFATHNITKENNVIMGDLNGESSTSSCSQRETSLSSVLDDCDENDKGFSYGIELNQTDLDSVKEEAASKYNSNQNFDSNLLYSAMLAEGPSDENKTKHDVSYRKVKYIKLKDICNINNKGLDNGFSEIKCLSFQNSTKVSSHDHRKNTSKDSYSSNLSFP